MRHITPDGLRLPGPVVETMAEAESLEAYRQAVGLRLASMDEAWYSCVELPYEHDTQRPRGLMVWKPLD